MRSLKWNGKVVLNLQRDIRKIALKSRTIWWIKSHNSGIKIRNFTIKRTDGRTVGHWYTIIRPVLKKGVKTRLRSSISISLCTMGFPIESIPTKGSISSRRYSMSYMQLDKDDFYKSSTTIYHPMSNGYAID